jgi:hypothetical protein
MDFNSMMIGTDNKDAMVEYYTKLLGDPTYTDESYAGWQIGSGWVNIGPHSDVHGRNASPGRLIWNIETTDVQANHRMKAAGDRRHRPYRSRVTRTPMGSPSFEDPTATTSSS